MLRLLWAPALAMLAISCSVQATIILQPDGSAAAQADLRLEPAARQAWNSLRDLDTTLPRDPFDATLWQQSLGSRGTVTSAGLTSSVTVQVPRLTDFVPSWKKTATGWEGTIDRAAVRRWAGLTAWGDSPALDSLVPAPGAAVSEKDYRGLLVYLLGGEAKVAEGLVDRSEFRLTVVAPQAIRSAPGAVNVSERTATYRWPLARVLSLETPIAIKLLF